MLSKFKVFACFCLAALLALTVLANTDSNFFSDKNFQALQKDPQNLFSKRNNCHLKEALGKQDYDLFSQAMSLMTVEDDEPNNLAISGNVKGLFTIFEGFFRMSKTGKVWIAYLYNNEVHYFTNDATTLKTPPKIMAKWSERFKDVKWISKQIVFDNEKC